jgi:aryl-alcohol dehydrogenase-like predicted oxidoreductase
MLAQRPFGATGFKVSIIGLGAGHIGAPELDEAEVGALLHCALDRGVTLIDTAPSYGLSEERIGRHLAARRDEYVLSTKCGYGVPGTPDWTGACIRGGIDAALGRLRTDRIDILHLHSPPVGILERDDVLDALEAGVRAGKVRVAAYSGDAEALDYALATGRFAAVQTSINLFDQRVLDHGLARARDRRLGVIAKRPLGNAPWRFAERPVGHYAEVYWERMRRMGVDTRGLPWEELALRFAAYQSGVSSCIVGTARPPHLERALDVVTEGALDPAHVELLRAAFRAHDDGWTQQV